MVTYDELVNLSKKSQGNYSLTEDELIAFVKGGAVRAYKAGDASRKDEDVTADFHAETKELQLSVKKKVVTTVQDSHKECSQQESNLAIGELAEIAVTDTDTYRAIDAAVQGMRRLIEANQKKENVDLVKTKFQEYKEHCLPAQVTDAESFPAKVSISGIEASLPIDEQVPTEQLKNDTELTVYVKELKQTENTSEIIVSRRHPNLVSHAMREVIPEVDLGNIEIKAVSRIPGIHSRIAVKSTDMGAVERCQSKAWKVSQLIGGEKVDFVEWYDDTKANIASAVKMEVRDVHLTEPDKQALVEVFKEQSASTKELSHQDIAILVQQLTGYKVEIKVVAKESGSELPGV